MSFAQLRDGRIHYELAGAAGAPVLVFSNSLGANLSMWEPQIASLRKDFRVLRYDTRGHGQSAVSPGPYSIEQLAGDILELLDALQLDRVHFCGLSMGGQTGMSIAQTAPSRLHKLILCNTAAKIGSPEMWKTRIEQVRKGGMKSVSGAVIERWLSKEYRVKYPDVAANTQRMLESANPDGYVANCAAVRDFDVRETIGKIRVPTLVIAGTHDAATTPGDGRYITERIQGARYTELNAAHLSNIEARDRFNSEVSAFLLSQ